MKKLTPLLNKSITQDWQSLVPQFAVSKPMQLARRIGPLIQGICLERDSSNTAYLPTLYVHSLCRPFPVLSLSLGQPLHSQKSGTIERLPVQHHEAKYPDACARLIASSLLPVEGNWMLAQLLEAYEKYRHLNNPDTRYPILIMEDAVSVCAWLGKYEIASSLANQYSLESQGWPENLLARQGGWSSWKTMLTRLASSGEDLKQTVSDQIESLNLTQIPTSELIA